MHEHRHKSILFFVFDSDRFYSILFPFGPAMKNVGFIGSYPVPVSEGKTPGMRILFRMFSTDDALRFPEDPGVPFAPVPVPLVVVDGVG